MAIEIVKVQVPIIGDPGTCLVYAKGHKHVRQQPLTNDVREKLKGDLKGYFKGAWSSIVGWGISERVADQDW